MDNPVKGSYRISRLLKRIIQNGFGDTFQNPDISDQGKQQSGNFYSDKRKAPTIKSEDPLSDRNPSSVKQQYLTYQKEVRAGKVSQDSESPQSPGKILKLPLDSETE